MTTIKKRPDDTYYFRHSTGRKLPMKSDPSRRAYEIIERKGFKTKREAEQSLNQIIMDLSRGLNSGNLRFSDFVDSWLPKHARKGSTGKPLSKRTVIGYQRTLDNFFYLHFGNMKLKDITAEHIETYFDELLLKGRTLQTCLQHYRFLSLIMKSAMRRGLVPQNVCQQVDAPRPPKKTIEEREEMVLNHAQQYRLLEVAQEDAFTLGRYTKEYLFNQKLRYTMIMLGLNVGLRMGEVLALQWKDIVTSTEKKDGKFVHVLKVQRATDGVGGTKLPKNNATRRIPLDDTLFVFLRDYKQWLFEYLGAESEWIVPDRKGSMVTASQPKSHQMRLLFDRAGVPGAFHTLRHTCITNWLHSVPNIKLVSTLAGHSNIAITLDLYGHVLEENAISEMDNLYSTMHAIQVSLNANKK
jgi:integrase|tara:strand:+ start:1378 stop:2610 length:1233 start_codon:yes stop_codon:yes gene_type:complete